MTEQSFFTDGAAYERLMGRWSRAVGEIFLDWLALPKGLNWLDVGCGTGAFTELLLARCAPQKISAIDPAEDQIAFARTRPGVSGVTFRVGDAQSLPFADSTFDAAAMALVISFVPDAAKAVAEMRRVVKPGGTAGTYMWDSLGRGYIQQPLIDALQAMNIEVPPSPARKNSRMEELRQFFEAAGFDQVETRAIAIEVSYPSFDDYWSSQTGLGNPAVQAIRKMPTADVERLKANLRATLPVHDGRIAYPARANAVKGRVPR
jgi:ubiquinone/menaquinone biosynthesis C-methylase UbiE